MRSICKVVISFLEKLKHMHCKKRLAIFPSPRRDVTNQQLSLAGHNLIIPGQGEFGLWQPGWLQLKKCKAVSELCHLALSCKEKFWSPVPKFNTRVSDGLLDLIKHTFKIKLWWRPVSATSPTMSRLVSDIPIFSLCLYCAFRTRSS